MSCSQHGLFTKEKKKKKKARGIFFELKTHARILPTLTADVKKRHCKHCSFCPCFHLPRKKKKKKTHSGRSGVWGNWERQGADWQTGEG